MASKVAFIVFILPVILSFIFGSAVLGEVLKQPDRELNMGFDLPETKVITSKSIKILGLENQYSTETPVEIQVAVSNPDFDCGDIYITIYDASSKEVITQNGFFDQCFASNNLPLPIGDEFSEIIDTPGSYGIEIRLNDKTQTETESISARFTVK